MKPCIQTGDIVDRLGMEKGYALFRQAGFEAIDWNLDHAWKSSDFRKGTYKGNCIFEKPLDEVISHYEAELNIIKKNGLTVSQAHAPFPAWLPDCPEILDYTIEVYKRNIEYCNYIGCKNLVIHGISYALSTENFTYDEIEELNLKLYTSLIPTLLQNDVIVCLENLFTGFNGVNYQGHCAEPNTAAAFIDRLNAIAGKEVFGFCLDTGHLNLLHEDFRVYVPILGKRIKCMHIHDNNGANDQHLAPITGTINWNHFCSSLKAAGYEGDLDFETFNQTNKAMDCDSELVGSWLKLIYDIGNNFIKKIQN